ncbi:MAG: GrpB family protein [Candidatus Methylacidiphilales bacterium]
MKIETYPPGPPEFKAWDPHVTSVADEVAAWLTSKIPGTRIEHVGSTAIPQCAGKGIIDLLVLYSAGDLERVRDAIDGLGFQKQPTGHLFPEERPMRVGLIHKGNHAFKIHTHILLESCEEARNLCSFRDALMSDSQLCEEYVALKKEILSRSVQDPEEYTDAKATFFQNHPPGTVSIE